VPGRTKNRGYNGASLAWLHRIVVDAEEEKSAIVPPKGGNWTADRSPSERHSTRCIWRVVRIERDIPERKFDLRNRVRKMSGMQQQQQQQ
jgi:hypothetical protein